MIANKHVLGSDMARAASHTITLAEHDELRHA